MTLRVVLGEDSLIVREGVRQLLDADPELEVVAVAGDMDSLRDACLREEPDVLITDIRMPPTNTDEGIRLASLLRESNPAVGVVVLSNYAEPEYALAAVAAGGSMMDSKIVEPLVAAKLRNDGSRLDALTAREREVLAEIAQGKSNTAIAESLFLTKRAVEKHVNSIFAKLDLPESQDVSRRVKATLIFLSEMDDGGELA